MSDALSVRGFARVIGVSHVAVLKAIKSGRLKRSIQQNHRGHAEIVDLALARHEWQANAGRVVKMVRAVPSEQAPPPGQALPAVPVTVTTDLPDEESGGSTLADAQRQLVLERIREKRLSTEQTIGTLVRLDGVEKVAFEAERVLRENILNVPDRIAGELAAETDAGRVHMRLEAALREALQATAVAYEQRAANG